jgi:hypothetical protein
MRVMTEADVFGCSLSVTHIGGLDSREILLWDLKAL